MDYSSFIAKYIEEERSILAKMDCDSISTVMNVLECARLEGRRIFVCGNGGSAATASHLECDFNKGISYDQDIKYDIECLSDNVPMMMAIANDISYGDIFVVPLRNKMKSGDIIIGFSGSGNSENVIKAFEYAKTIGGITISFTGYDGGRLKDISVYNIHVDINNMQIVEDVHLIMNHLMMYVLANNK